MDYVHINPNAEIRFCDSNMILHTDLDAAYLVASNTRSQAAIYHYCDSHNGRQFNGPIHVLAKIIKKVMTTTMEAEIAALYINTQVVIVFRQTLIHMGHPQPPIIICTDNKTACDSVIGTIKQQHSKPIDMHFHWLKDYVNKQTKIKLVPGAESLADYSSKHHLGSWHRKVRPINI